MYIYIHGQTSFCDIKIFRAVYEFFNIEIVNKETYVISVEQKKLTKNTCRVLFYMRNKEFYE